MRSRLPYATTLTLLLGTLVSAPASGQTFDDPQEPPAEPLRRYFTFSAGVTRFVGDLGEGNFSSTGPTLRAGIQLPSASAAITFGHWPDVNRFSMTALQLELSQDLATRRRVTPVLIAAVGHTWGHYDGPGLADEVNGASGAFGIGLDAKLTSRFSLTTDMRLRTDDGGWNGEWRVLSRVATSAADIPTPSSRRTNVISTWMTPFGGRWATSEPALGVQVAQDNGVLTIQVAPWHMPDDDSPGARRWDTRAVIASAQSDRRLVGDVLHGRFGPAVAAMGEGTDSGVSVGYQVDLVLGTDIGGFRLEGTAGLLWLKRVGGGSSSQRGLTWGLAIGR